MASWETPLYRGTPAAIAPALQLWGLSLSNFEDEEDQQAYQEIAPRLIAAVSSIGGTAEVWFQASGRKVERFDSGGAVVGSRHEYAIVEHSLDPVVQVQPIGPGPL